LKGKIRRAQGEVEQSSEVVSSATEARLKLEKQVYTTASVFLWNFSLTVIIQYPVFAFWKQVVTYSLQTINLASRLSARCIYLIVHSTMQLLESQVTCNCSISENQQLKASVDRAIAAPSELAEYLRVEGTASHALIANEAGDLKHEDVAEYSFEGT